MEEKHLLDLLESHGVKPTANRIVIARALAAAGRPMSMTELETVVETIDKSNVCMCWTTPVTVSATNSATATMMARTTTSTSISTARNATAPSAWKIRPSRQFPFRKAFRPGPSIIC